MWVKLEIYFINYLFNIKDHKAPPWLDSLLVMETSSPLFTI